MWLLVGAAGCTGFQRLAANSVKIMIGIGAGCSLADTALSVAVAPLLAARCAWDALAAAAAAAGSLTAAQAGPQALRQRACRTATARTAAAGQEQHPRAITCTCTRHAASAPTDLPCVAFAKSQLGAELLKRSECWLQGQILCEHSFEQVEHAPILPLFPAVANVSTRMKAVLTASPIAGAP